MKGLDSVQDFSTRAIDTGLQNYSLEHGHDSSPRPLCA
jgi:hypothetical protein